MAGRPRNAVVLTEDERAALLRWTRSRTCSQGRALRARIVLACEGEPTNTAVAGRLGVSRDMVGKWRARFLAERLAGLDEQPRPGRPPTTDDDTLAHVLVQARQLRPPHDRVDFGAAAVESRVREDEVRVEVGVFVRVLVR